MKSWNSFSNQLTEKKSPKDYDGDGVVETGSKEHAGVVHNAIQRAKGKKADGKDTRKEEVENIDETALGDKARAKAVEMGRKRRSTKEYKAGGARGTGKNERAAYDLANAQQSTNADLGSQKRTDKSSGMRGHQNKSVKKTGSYDYGAVLDKKDPKKNPKHTANKKTTKEEVQQVDEFVGGKPGDGYIGHPNLDIKNPLAKKQVKGPTGNQGLAGKLGDRKMRIDRMTNKMLNQSLELEGELVDENIGSAVGGALEKGANFMKRNPVGKTIRSVLKPVGSGAGTARPSVRTQDTIRKNQAGMESVEHQGEVVDEGKKELDREKRNKMFRRAGNLSREALKGGDKGTEAGKKSAKIVKAINKDNEGKDRNDVKEGYGEPDEKLVTGRKMFTIPDAEKSAAAARLKEKARKKREEKMKEEVKVETPVVEEAESKSQQRLMGLALSVKRGDTPMSSVTPQVVKMAREMKEKDLKDFAGTKHDGLPEKVKSEEPELSSPLVESLVESAAQRMAAKARREDAQAKRVDRQSSGAQQRAGLNVKK
jgi:hypothetical protein